MASKYHDLIEVTPEVEAYVDRSLKIVAQIRQVLRAKGLTQRDLAVMLDKKESEICRMLSGSHNLTVRTITRIEVKLGTQLITTPQEVQANAAALLLYDTVATEEVVADWQPIPPSAMLASPSSKRSAARRTPKAAEESAAFFAELACAA